MAVRPYARLAGGSWGAMTSPARSPVPAMKMAARFANAGSPRVLTCPFSPCRFAIGSFAEGPRAEGIPKVHD